MSKTEMVVCLPTHVLKALEINGAKSVNHNELLQKLDVVSEQYVIASRTVVEEQPSLRQLIPYVIVKNVQGEVLCYKRKGGNEKRLEDLYSIGIGGHVNLLDVSPNLKTGLIQIKETLRANIQREIKEELKNELMVLESFNSRFIGFLALSDTKVDQVHLGLVAEIIIDKNVIRLDNSNTEEGLVNISWVKPEELKQLNLESWSRKSVEVLM